MGESDGRDSRPLEEMYQNRINRLEKFAKNANLSQAQKRELYHIAREFFEYSGLIYSLSQAPVNRTLKSKLIDADNKAARIAADLVRREDSQ